MNTSILKIIPGPQNWLNVRSRELEFAENDKSYKKQKERQNIEISRIIERIVR